MNEVPGGRFRHKPGAGGVTLAGGLRVRDRLPPYLGEALLGHHPRSIGLTNRREGASIEGGEQPGRVKARTQAPPFGLSLLQEPFRRTRHRVGLGARLVGRDRVRRRVVANDP